MVFRLLSVVAGLTLAFAANAQGSPAEGVDYIELKPPQSTESSGKVEVIEFFWYRCPHCYSLEPDLESWVKRLPRDVQFKRVPGILNDDGGRLARQAEGGHGQVRRRIALLHRREQAAPRGTDGPGLSPGRGPDAYGAGALPRDRQHLAKGDARHHRLSHRRGPQAPQAEALAAAGRRGRDGTPGTFGGLAAGLVQTVRTYRTTPSAPTERSRRPSRWRKCRWAIASPMAKKS